MQPLSFTFVLFALLACAAAQYSSPIEVGPSTNPALVTAASIKKVGDLANDMYNRWAVLDQDCDPRAVFAVAYLYMTANAKKLIINRYFDDGNKMADFILNFASRYTYAYDNWAANNTNAVSQPWKTFFSFAASGHSDVTEDITIGMNAHINYDLGISTYDSGYAVPAWAPDFYRINDLMNQIDINVTLALGRYDPQFYNTDFVYQAYFTASVQAVSSWRTGAYAEALSYQAAFPLGPLAVSAAQSVSLASAIAAAQSFAFPYPNSTRESRRAYCMTQNQTPLPAF